VALEASSDAPRQHIEDHETGVVPVSRIVRAGIAQTDDQPKVSVHQLAPLDGLQALARPACEGSETTPALVRFAPYKGRIL
jgi:hypothetical protein